jgi:hypothetical protein
MAQVRSFSVANGDMFYIRHGSDNFTIIDCNLQEERLGGMLAEISAQSKGKGVTRFISTHPDQDHISGLVELDDHIGIRNFYCVKNAATKSVETEDFKRYRQLHDSDKAFYIYKGVTRSWMNKEKDGRGSSGLTVLWPDRNDLDFQSVLADAAAGMAPNNISPIIKYQVNNGVSMLWMGDLERDFMEKLESKVAIPKVDVLFAPHHGRTSGKVPKEWLKKMDPQMIVIGEAPAEYLHYYSGYNTITQNSCGDILFDATGNKTHVYVGDAAYSIDYLADEGLDILQGLYYIGTIYS